MFRQGNKLRCPVLLTTISAARRRRRCRAVSPSARRSSTPEKDETNSNSGKKWCTASRRGPGHPQGHPNFGWSAEREVPGEHRATVLHVLLLHLASVPASRPRGSCRRYVPGTPRATGSRAGAARLLPAARALRERRKTPAPIEVRIGAVTAAVRPSSATSTRERPVAPPRARRARRPTCAARTRQNRLPRRSHQRAHESG